jgi:hypothetical protein
VDHLAEVAGQINRLMLPAADSVGSIGKGVGRAASTPTTREMLHALGFTSKGKNAFRDAGSELRSVRAAARYRSLRGAKLPARQALETVMDWLGEGDEGNAKKAIGAGSRILRGKTSQ